MTVGPPPASDTADGVGRRAQAFRRCPTGTSRLHGRVATALGGSDEALRALEAAGARQPALVLAALHDLVLAGRAPSLAAAYAGGDLEPAGLAAVETVVRRADEVVAVAAGRRLRTGETGLAAVLHPAVARAASRAGADAVGLVGLRCSAGSDLQLDRVGVAYDDGRSLGDPTSPVQHRASVRGGRPVPVRPLPGVVARVGVDRDPLDVADADDVRWLRACVPPDEPGRAAALEAELALAVGAPPVLLRGDEVERLPDAVELVPAGALPVLMTTWALSSWTPARRRALLRRLEDVAARRPVAWVSVEGVGVAPGVPTLGDRPASGHSTVGVTVLDGSRRRVEVVGRCWGRGRWLSWLADEDGG